MQKQLVLFLCVGNSCRSQMAETLLRRHAGDRFEVASAGLKPKPIDPMTLEVLEEIGIETSGLRSKDSSDFLGRAAVRYAVVVCDAAQADCPRFFPFSGENLYWPFDDPAAFVGPVEERRAKFRRVRDQIDDRIRGWLRERGEEGTR